MLLPLDTQTPPIEKKQQHILICFNLGEYYNALILCGERHMKKAISFCVKG